MGFTNVDYNRNLKFDDDNPFKTHFDEAREAAKNRAEEAYDKRKADYIEDFFQNLRKQFMPPKHTPILKDGRLNKGFYKIMSYDPETIFRKAKQGARKAGLASNAIKEGDILNERLTGLKNEAVKRHYMLLNNVRSEIGPTNLEKILLAEGPKFLKFYNTFTDPYTERPLHAGSWDNDLSKVTGVKKSWLDLDKKLGWSFNKDGQVTNIPGWWDGESAAYDVEMDEEGNPYVDTGQDWFGPVNTAWKNLFGGGGAYSDRVYLPQADKTGAKTLPAVEKTTGDILYEGLGGGALTPMGMQGTVPVVSSLIAKAMQRDEKKAEDIISDIKEKERKLQKGGQ